MILTFPGQEYILNPAEVASGARLIGPKQRPVVLTYRGLQYEAMPVEAAPAKPGRTGMYRGNRFSLSNSQPTPRANVMLTYRGISYSR